MIANLDKIRNQWLMENDDQNRILEILNRPLIAVAYFVVAMAVIPLNDSIIKLMSDRFSIFQILAIRAAIALFFLMLFPIVWSSLTKLSLKTWLKILARGMCLVGAMLFFFLPLATLGLAEVTAIFFTAPLIISVLSVPLLGEQLGPFRIAAVIFGMIGTLIIVKPGSSDFQLAYLMPIASAVSYSAFQLITRYLRNEVAVPAMVAAQNMIYLAVGALGVLCLYLFAPIVPDGEIWGFLLRGWQTPNWSEFGLLCIAAFIVLNLSIASTNAYTSVEATYVAPFEYVAMPMAVLWGIVFWGDWPDLSSWIGIVLILLSGIAMIYREYTRQKTIASSVSMRAAIATGIAPLDDEVGKGDG